MEDDIAIEDLLGQKFDEDVFKIATGPRGAKSNVGQPLQCPVSQHCANQFAVCKNTQLTVPLYIIITAI